MLDYNNSTVTAMQINHVIACTLSVLFKNANRIAFVYAIYYGLMLIFAIYVALVGTVYVDSDCPRGIIVILCSYGYIRLAIGIFSLYKWRKNCELTACLSVTMSIFNHALLIFFLIFLFERRWPSEEDSHCLVPLFSTQSLMGFVGICTLIFVVLIYGALYTVVWAAWSKKKELRRILERRRNVKTPFVV